jgi:putative intracellular protease/amidase
MSAILLVLTSHDDLGGRYLTGFSVPDAAHAWCAFRQAGVDVDLTSVRGGRPPMHGFERGDPAQLEFVQLSGLATTRQAAEVDSVGYDGIFYVGGHGALFDFPDDRDLARLGRDVHESDGVVAAVGHGAAALVNLSLSTGSYLVEGKEVSSFTNAEEDMVGLLDVVPFPLQTALEERGAKHVNGPVFACQVSVADRLVTGQNLASTRRTAEEVVRLLSRPKT